jgi:hypothetical protein
MSVGGKKSPALRGEPYATGFTGTLLGAGRPQGRPIGDQFPAATDSPGEGDREGAGTKAQARGKTMTAAGLTAVQALLDRQGGLGSALGCLSELLIVGRWPETEKSVASDTEDVPPIGVYDLNEISKVLA